MSGNGERGASLILALLLLLAVAMFGAAAASRTHVLAVAQARDRAGAPAVYAASGGIEQARWSLARDPSYTGETLRVGDTEVHVSVTGTGDARSVLVRAERRAPPWQELHVSTVRATLVLATEGGELPRVVSWRE